MKHSHILSIMFIVLLLMPSGAPLTVAQDQADANAEVKTADVQPTEESAVESDEDVDAQEDDENFIPTEKINVDSSVSFPVDI